MKVKEQEKLLQHYDTYFQQTTDCILHPIVMEPHIDAALYPPNTALPCWKLATIGASDHKMTPNPSSLGDRNEYVMFIDPEIGMTVPEMQTWFFQTLMEVAHYPIATEHPVSYGHCIEWKPEEGG